ncbi:phytanoyl-CoA dioxygenase family protein [Methylibium rhizosphaerae]|uniref:phytanoyl-CoA dioxygenase family protein n=1 Tax=Methylibium rhizosphaerae TaxID=2570323 RepID=UPI00112B22B4|nr:phytanoyl-CoA dioxygenase family protein [Methylibium rhizosphaerae]
MQVSSDSFEAAGYAAVSAVLDARTCEAISRRIRTSSISGGTRNLLAKPWCVALVERLRKHPGLSAVVPSGHLAIQCTYFEKSASRNWAVSAHQDLSIPVAERIEGAGLTGWSRKEGSLFVQPPAELLGQLVAVRVHLEACTAADGPLSVIPGSHRFGRMTEHELAAARRSTAEVTCTATAGEALAMRPLLVHSSRKASGSSRRRVLHLVFGPRIPGYGLRWQYAA